MATAVAGFLFAGTLSMLHFSASMIDHLAVLRPAFCRSRHTYLCSSRLAIAARGSSAWACEPNRACLGLIMTIKGNAFLFLVILGSITAAMVRLTIYSDAASKYSSASNKELQSTALGLVKRATIKKSGNRK
jgi:hypothetical protein